MFPLKLKIKTNNVNIVAINKGETMTMIIIFRQNEWGVLLWYSGHIENNEDRKWDKHND